MKSSWLRFVIVAVAVMSFTILATGQNDSAGVRAVYEASATVRTNIEGIRTFNAPPANFNPLKASDEELATYGFPPRPDQATDPAGLAKWNKAMSIATRRWNGELRPRQFQNQPMKPGPSISNTARSTTSANWSAIVNTNTLKKYSSKTSYYYIFSEFNVPVAQQAFNGSGGNICDGGWDIASIWNGIDGFSTGDVLQGGIDSAYYCNGTTKEDFYASWIEWFPAGSVYEYYVNPGDDIYVETWNTSDTNGYVWIEDLTQQISASYNLTAPSGTTLVGNSAEFAVERPGGDTTSTGLYPLANYIASFWDYSGDYTFKNTLGYPGSTATSTYLVTMYNDAGTEAISVPNGITTSEPIGQGLTGAGLAGKYSIFFQNENCAYSGGC